MIKIKNDEEKLICVMVPAELGDMDDLCLEVITEVIASAREKGVNIWISLSISRHSEMLKLYKAEEQEEAKKDWSYTFEQEINERHGTILVPEKDTSQEEFREELVATIKSLESK